jgi:protein SCO1/2
MTDISPCIPSLAAEPAGWRQRRSALGRFFTGDGLPVFLMAALLVYEFFLLTVLFAPASWGAWGAFAEEFKIWCFSYDPRTGGMEWMSVVIMLAEPVFIVGLVVLIWRFGRTGTRGVGGWLRHPRAALAGLGLGLCVAGSLYALGRPSVAEAPLPPFPGERIRTQLPLPAFALADHRGRPVSSGDLRGRVTLVTGVYAMCSTTCPEILLQVKALLEVLPAGARERLDVLALSLSPEYDTAELMAGVADAYGLAYPGFRYANGSPDAMRPLLRDFQFSPRRDEATGQVVHANLFILVDAGGRIAYRFNLDPRHEAWLRDAVLALVQEVHALPPGHSPSQP